MTPCRPPCPASARRYWSRRPPAPCPARIVARVASRWTCPRRWHCVGTCDGPFGVTASGGQIAEAGERVGVLCHRLGPAGRNRSPAARRRAGCGRTCPPSGACERVAAGPVADPSRTPWPAGAFRSVTSAGDRYCRGAAQRGLGVLDDLPVQPRYSAWLARSATTYPPKPRSPDALAMRSAWKKYRCATPCRSAS